MAEFVNLADYTEIKACRNCRGSVLETILDMGQVAISDFKPKPDSPEQTAPLELVKCWSCGMVQIRHTVSRARLYSRYWYRSSISASVKAGLRDVTKLAEKLVPLEDGDIVCDIASNDGALLESYSKPRRPPSSAIPSIAGQAGLHKLGFDPAENLAEEAMTRETKHFTKLFSAQLFLDWTGGHKAKVITSCAVFYHLEDPNAFTADVARCLADDGVWILEASYLPSMLENHAVDSIGHEHLSHLSLAVITEIVERHGLDIVDGWLGGLNCGVIRLVIRHRGAHLTTTEDYVYGRFGDARVAGLMAAELQLSLDSMRPYDQFKAGVEARKQRFRGEIVALLNEGARIYGIGASTKGAILAGAWGIDADHIRGTFDPNTDKHWTFCSGSQIPVLPMGQMEELKPDVLVVFPFHLRDEIIGQNQAFRERGGKFLFPLPDVELV